MSPPSTCCFHLCRMWGSVRISHRSQKCFIITFYPALRSPFFLMLLLLYPPDTDLGLKQHGCPGIEFRFEGFADLILWVCVYLLGASCLVVIIWIWGDAQQERLSNSVTAWALSGVRTGHARIQILTWLRGKKKRHNLFSLLVKCSDL